VTTGVQPALARITSPGLGTAFAISNRTALTAFHCIAVNGDFMGGDTVDRTKRQQVVEKVELLFKPTSVPVAEEAASATVVDGDSIRDWAILELESPISSRWRPFQVSGGELDPGTTFLISGFPGRVHPGITGPLPGQVEVQGNTIREDAPVVVLSSSLIGHGVDARGMSGGPVFTRDGRTAVGLVLARLMQGNAQAGGALFACAATEFAEPARLGQRLGSVGPLPKKADERLVQEAISGEASAASRMGVLLQAQGDTEEADSWLRRAAAGGDAAAAYFVGISMDPDGTLIQRDPARAREALAWFRRAATSGDVYGMTTMGIRLRQHGHNEAALPWLEEAVERGADAMAAHTLARIYADRGELKLAEDYERMAAEQGDVRAAYEFACMLIGHGEHDQAIAWLRDAALDPDAVAMLHELGVEP
jgi:Trypsin-like peptidase domain